MKKTALIFIALSIALCSLSQSVTPGPGAATFSMQALTYNKLNGTLTVTPTGGTVSIANTPTNVNVSSTVTSMPSVTISGTPTVSAGGFTAKSSSTITTSASPDYSVNDNIGGINTMTLVGFANGASGYIFAVDLWDKTGTAPALTIDYWDTSPSGTYTDNVAEVIAGDEAVYLGSLSIAAGDWVTLGTNSRCLINKVIPFKCTAATKSIYFTIVTSTAYNAGTTSDITVKHFINQNTQ